MSVRRMLSNWAVKAVSSNCCTAPGGAAIVLWVRGRTICAAVAPMDGTHLMAHIAEADVPGAW